MGKTYTMQDALHKVGADMPRAREDSIALFALNDALNLFWDSYDWRETFKELPPFWLSPDVQDYGKPFYAVPSDFSRLHQAYILDIESDDWRQELKTGQSELPLTTMRCLPTNICYVGEGPAFRVWPRPPEGLDATKYVVDGKYKYRPTKITSANMGAYTLPWDDRYFPAFCACLVWALTPDASQEKIPRFQVAQMMLVDAASIEGLDLGSPSVAPSEPLVHSSIGLYL